MGATLFYTEQAVGEQIQCDCGYESDYVDYDYSSDTVDVAEDWRCPSCGCTSKLEEEFI